MYAKKIVTYRMRQQNKNIESRKDTL